MTDARDVDLRGLTTRVSADAYGLHVRRPLRRWSVPWGDVADLRVHLTWVSEPGHDQVRRVSVLLRDGRKRSLPLPFSLTGHDPEFDAHWDALRALHRRHGHPESRHVPIVSRRTAGRGGAGLLLLCVVLLAVAGGVARSVPGAAAQERAWQAAEPCAAETPVPERRTCLSTWPAVIVRTEVAPPKKPSRLYFADGRPRERVEVSRDAALTFRSGDRVELAFWRGDVMSVAGERYVWHAHVPTPGTSAAVAAGLVLAAGYPGALLVLRRRRRRLPADEVAPSAVPFVFALVGTALWLLPLAYLHPTSLPATPAAIAWMAAGCVATAGLLAWAWRVTAVRSPAGPGAAQVPVEETEDDEGTFLAARFLEHTDYNPYGFGTHIALGGGPLAVTPGPYRFAAKRIPVERLTVVAVRRPRGDDGDTVPSTWHIAELDDGGRTVRLAAPPATLARILRELPAKFTVATPGRP